MAGDAEDRRAPRSRPRRERQRPRSDGVRRPESCSPSDSAGATAALSSKRPVPRDRARLREGPGRRAEACPARRSPSAAPWSGRRGGQNAPMAEPARHFFNCSNCPAYCCTYEHIETIRPICAVWLALRPVRKASYEKFSSRSKSVEPSESCAIARTRSSPPPASSRREDAQCTIYEARLHICRASSGTALRLLRLPDVRAQVAGREVRSVVPAGLSERGTGTRGQRMLADFHLRNLASWRAPASSSATASTS
jgi:hypothetical protein